MSLDEQALEQLRKRVQACGAEKYHAANTADVMTFSLVQGSAMGGGFEATLAGEVALDLTDAVDGAR